MINNIKPYRVDISDEAITYFINETKTYWKKIEFYNDDGTLNNSKVNNHIKTLDMISKDILMMVLNLLYAKKLETDLVIIFL